jgi:hypothetical protein
MVDNPCQINLFLICFAQLLIDYRHHVSSLDKVIRSYLKLAFVFFPDRVIQVLFLKVHPQSPRGDCSEYRVWVQQPTGEISTPTMATLPGNVLLDIFDFYRNDFDHTLRPVWKWHLLVHVCRRWRQIIFESPRRLDLNIHCTCKTPVRKSLGIWPAFPIAVDCRLSFEAGPGDEDNTLAALEQPDRVRYLKFDLKNLALEEFKFVAATQKPFPALTHLIILSKPNLNIVTLPAEFLGSFAPRLQIVFLRNIVFPTLPTLLASASDLIELQLRRIRRASYISPMAMALCLVQLPRLKTLVIRFQYSISSTGQTQTPLITRIVLPALTNFEFTGASEYLEDLVPLIDAPRQTGS